MKRTIVLGILLAGLATALGACGTSDGIGTGAGIGGSVGGSVGTSGGTGGLVGPTSGSGPAAATGGAAPAGGTGIGGSSGGTAPAGGTGGTTGGTGGTTGGTGGATGGTGGATGGTGGATGGAGGTGGETGGTGGQQPPVEPDPDLIGWAAWPGTGWNGVTLDTTTGGGNATPVTVTSMIELNTLAAGDTPAVIHVSGQLTGEARIIGSNKTIIGLPGARIDGALIIGPLDAAEAAVSALLDNQEGGVHNIIVKNLTIQGGEDTININYSHHIWIDHLDITDGSDGLIDIVRASDFITVSYTKIHYHRGGAHRLASLVGNRNDLGAIDTDRLRVTFHHNYWGSGIQGRQPRARFGKLHLFNNLHDNGAKYAVRCGVHVSILSERNIYVGQSAFNYEDSSADACLKSVEDSFVNSGSTGGRNEDSVFEPPYPYTPDPTEGLREILEANVGPK